MKYKLFCTDMDWLPKEGSGIKLWREDSEGRSLWPRGVPLPVVHSPMRNVQDIFNGISGFVKYRENLCNEDITREFRRRYEHLVHYWHVVKEALHEPIEPSAFLRDAFCLSMEIEATVDDQYVEDGGIRKEFADDEAFVGLLRDRPLQSFRLGRDLSEGFFAAI